MLWDPGDLEGPSMNRRHIAQLVGALIASLGLAGSSAFVLGSLPPCEP